MKNASSGARIPVASYEWLPADQDIAANSSFITDAFAIGGAAYDSVVVVASNAQLPATAGGSYPSVRAQMTAAGMVRLIISNQSAAALVPTGGSIVIQIMSLPIIP